jgi:hypothetical protein
MRNPGARGAKVTVTAQEVPANSAPVQVVLPKVKSSLGAPWVTTFGVPKVVSAVTLYFSVAVCLQGAGVVCAPGQTLALPELNKKN